jgi:phosphopantothenoylcysteine decarboxylase/phosphopantothenate--cysteine ligase
MDLVPHWHHEIDNIFKGQLGFMFAKELARRGVITYLVQRKDSIFESIENLAAPVTYYKTFDELAAILREILPRVKPDLVFMTAAPPDYAPIALDGKMSSDEEEITITYRKTPKLIDEIRELAGPQCFIAGSKLLVGVNDDVMLTAAKKQLKRANSNVCIGNDLKKIKPQTGEHPFLVTFYNGETIHFTGKKEDTSLAVLEEILKRVGSNYKHD